MLLEVFSRVLVTNLLGASTEVLLEATLAHDRIRFRLESLMNKPMGIQSLRRLASRPVINTL